MMQELENSLPLGNRLDNRYRIESILGEGGFGITYKAHDEKLDCNVAIKEYFPGDFASRISDTITVQARTNRIDEFQFGLGYFLQEARVLAKFQHSNIVRVSNFIEQNGTAYLVMEFAEGIPLNEWLKKNKTNVDEKTILDIIIPILKGLVDVHRYGLMHRDIKPGNIFLRKVGGPLLIDFGAARQALGEHSRSLSAIIVSMGYAPPEQYTSRGKQGPFTDLYAVGAVIYKIITGITPVESLERSHAINGNEKDPLAPIKVAGQGKVSDWLLEITDQLLNISPKYRPQSAQEVLYAIQHKTPVEMNGELSTRVYATNNNDKTQVVEEGKRFTKKPLTTAPVLTNRPVIRNKITLIVISVTAIFLVAGGGWWYNENSTQIAHNIKPDIKSIQKLNAKKPVKYDAILYVNSTPEGATVFLNNKKIGVTPYKANHLPTGKRQLKLSYKDYKNEVSDVNLQSNIILKKNYQLIPVSGNLNVFSQPNGARIYIDGVDMQQTTPATLLNIPAGEHKLKLHKDKYYDLTTTVQVKKDTTLREKFRLKGGRLISYKGKWITLNEMKKIQAKVKKQIEVKLAQKKLELKRQQDKIDSAAKVAIAKDEQERKKEIEKQNKAKALAEQYISLAEKEAKQYNFDQADEYLRKLIAVAPMHQKIAVTQQKIFDYKNKKRQQDAEAEQRKVTELKLQQKNKKDESSIPRRSFGGF